MIDSVRPLSGVSVNLSISESEHSLDRGFPRWQVNRITVEVSSALLGQGASVIFGHDWREDGVMEAIYGLARQMQDTSGLLLRANMINVLPWPDRPSLDSHLLDHLKGTLRIESPSLPLELNAHGREFAGGDPKSPTYQYIRARGLTHLRHRLNALSQARICLGGRQAGWAGRYPGIVEEALLALDAGKPLYISGLFGGAAADVIDAIRGGIMPDDFCRNPAIQAVYHSPPIREADDTTAADRVVDPGAVWTFFREAGPSALAATNGLTVEENGRLFDAATLEGLIELILVGLGRVRHRLTGRGREG